MTVLRVCEGKDYTIDVARNGSVSFDFWDEKEQPMPVTEHLFSRSEWLNIISSTVDLMDEGNFKEAVSENVERARREADKGGV